MFRLATNKDVNSHMLECFQEQKWKEHFSMHLQPILVSTPFSRVATHDNLQNPALAVSDVSIYQFLLHFCVRCTKVTREIFRFITPLVFGLFY